MIERGFDASLYPRAAIEAALAVYGSVASLALDERDGQFVVRITPSGAVDAELLANELSNYVLGTAVESRGVA